jgi:hypothetical protein
MSAPEKMQRPKPGANTRLTHTLMAGAGLLACGACLTAPAMVAGQDPGWPSQLAVSEAALGELRGGFVVDLVNTSRFFLPDVGHITEQQARAASTALTDAGLVQIGAGNSVIAAAQAQMNGGTIIQNSLSDQNIQTLTVINTGVNSQSLFQAANVRSVLNEALAGSLTPR